jgi:hypothetical protein
MKAKTSLTQDEIVFLEKIMFILTSAIAYPSSKFIWWGRMKAKGPLGWKAYIL